MSNKLALIINGQPRTFEFCFPSLKKHILDVYHPDVYICTDDKEERIVELYKPTAIDVLTQEEIFDSAIPMRANIPSVMAINDLSFNWKMQKAMARKSEYEAANNFIYDTVAITRFDVKFQSVPDIVALSNTCHVPLIGGYWTTPPDKPGIHWGGYSCHLFWSTSAIMNRIANIYFDEFDYLTSATKALENFGWAPEHVWKHFIDVNKIGVKFENINMMLIRGSNNNPLAFDNSSLQKYPEYL